MHRRTLVVLNRVIYDWIQQTRQRSFQLHAELICYNFSHVTTKDKL